MVIIVKANFRLKQHENCLAFSAGLILILFYILFLFFCSFVRLVKKFSLLQIIKRIQKFCITTVYKACIETSWSREIKFDSLPKAWKVNMNTIFEGTYIPIHTYILRETVSYGMARKVGRWMKCHIAEDNGKYDKNCLCIA